MNIRQFPLFLCAVSAIYLFGSRCNAQGPLGPRVGDDIDAEEQVYFGLFPTVNGFISAHIAAAGDGADITITRAAGDTVVHLGSGATKELEAYIDNLEAIFREERQLRWDSLAGIVRPGNMIQKGDRLEVKTRDGETHVGTILFATDSTVTLWEGTDPYDWRKLEERGSEFHYSRIEGISWPGFPLISTASAILAGGLVAWTASNVQDEPTTFLFKGTVAAGIVWGTVRSFDLAPPLAGDGNRFQSVAGRLQGHAMFDRVLPPEMRDFIHRRESAVTFHWAQLPSTDEQIAARVMLPSFHISASRFMGGLIADNRAQLLDLSPVQGFSPMSQTTVVEEPWTFGAAYSPIDRVRLGGSVTFYAEPPIHHSDIHEERLFGHELAVTADVVIIPHDPLLRPNRWQYNRFELSAGAGVTFNSFTIDGLRNTGTMYPQTDTLYSATRNPMGTMVHVALDYYMIQNYSVRIGLERQWIASVETPPAGEFHLFPEYASAHSINPSTFGGYIGAELHF